MEGELSALRSEASAREVQLSKEAARQVEDAQQQQQVAAQQMVAELHKLKQQVRVGETIIRLECWQASA
jgi:hypothetical protein